MLCVPDHPGWDYDTKTVMAWTENELRAEMTMYEEDRSVDKDWLEDVKACAEGEVFRRKSGWDQESTDFLNKLDAKWEKVRKPPRAHTRSRSRSKEKKALPEVPAWAGFDSGFRVTRRRLRKQCELSTSDILEIIG